VLNNHFTTKEVIIGVAIGSLIVSVGALLMAPKAGKWKKSMSDVYEDIADRTHGMTDSMIKKSKCLMHMNCAEPDWTQKAKSLLSDMSKYLTCSKKNDVKCDLFEKHGPDFLVGALAGGIVGAVAGLLVAPKPGDKLRSDFIDAYEDMSDKTQEFTDTFQKKGKKIARTAQKQANKWLDLAHTVINEFVDNAEEINDQVTEKVKDYADSGKERVGQALEWAALGLKVWKSLTKNR